MSRNRRLYVITAIQIALGLGALAIVTVWVPVGSPIAIAIGGAAPSTLLGLAFWVALTLIGSSLAGERPAGAIVTFDVPFITAATVLGGPVAGGWVAMIGSLERRELQGLARRGPDAADAEPRVPWYGLLANHALTTFPAVLGGVVVLAGEALLAMTGIDSRGGLATLVATSVVAALIVVVTDALAFETLALRSDRSLTDALGDLGRDHWLMMAAEAAIAWLMVEVFVGTAWWAPIACVAALLGVWRSWPSSGGQDPLTGLLTAEQFSDRVARLLDRRHVGRRAVVMRLEIGNLESINRRLGRRGGDRVLQEVARRLRHSLRPLDDAARLEGGIFAALLLLEAEQGDVRAEAIAHRIHAQVSADLVEEERVEIRIAIGVALEGQATSAGAADFLDSARFACQWAQARALPVGVRIARPLHRDLSRELGMPA